MKRALFALLCAYLLLALAAPPAGMITEVSVSASHTAAYVGETITWAAYDMDGSGDYQYHFEIDCDNWPVFIDDWDNWRLEPSVSWVAAKPGTYKASVMVYDLGWDDYSENTSTDTIVSLRPATAITSLSWRTGPDGNNQLQLLIDLAWTPIEGAVGYEIFARVGDVGRYKQWTETIESSVAARFLLPAAPTRYWFKVRAYGEYYDLKSEKTIRFTEPFSPEAFIDVPALASQQGKTIKPFITLVIPHLVTPAPTRRRVIPNLVTPAPTRRLTITALPLTTPAPIR